MYAGPRRQADPPGRPRISILERYGAPARSQASLRNPLRGHESQGIPALVPEAKPKATEFDVWVNVEIARKMNTVAALTCTSNRILILDEDRFDHIELGSNRTYKMTIRVVAIRLPNGAIEYLLTNLPKTEFPAEKIKELYALRWGIEVSFSMLKGSLGMEAFHCKKPQFAQQEVWGKLIVYNFISTIKGAADKLIEAETEEKKAETKVSRKATSWVKKTLPIRQKLTWMRMKLSDMKRILPLPPMNAENSWSGQVTETRI